MKITDLGDISGDVLVFGGVYSNFHALNALFDYAKSKGIAPSNMICTGDVVAYCAHPEECVSLIRDLGCPVLAGNCEKQLAKDADDCGCGFEEGSTCSVLSNSWYAHAKREISEQSMNWMGDLPDRITFIHEGLRYGVVHGGASDISRFIWPVSSEKEIHTEMTVLADQIGYFDRVLAGHTGIQMNVEVGQKSWINAGAIGMPCHDGNSQTTFSIISEKYILNKRLEYDAKAEVAVMIAKSLSQGYHETLLTGYWPSEETLPASMRI